MSDAKLDGLTFWLNAKWRRHGEIEDKDAADAFTALRAKVAELERLQRATHEDFETACDQLMEARHRYEKAESKLSAVRAALAEKRE